MVILGALLVVWSLVGGAESIYHQIEYEFFEEQPVGTKVGNIAVDVIKSLHAGSHHPQQTSNNNNNNNNVHYGQRTDNHYFRVDEQTGDIICVRVVDREHLCPPYSSSVGCDRQVLEVTLRPHVTSSSSSSSSALQQLQLIKVIIRIVDINDHGPVFPQEWEVIELVETTSVGTTFGIPEAEDADSESLSVQNYRLKSVDDAERDEDTSQTFKLMANRQVDGSHEVKVRLMRPLDLETRHFYSLVLLAVDGGSPPRSGTVQLHIYVRDANDNSPTFDSVIYEVRVDENVQLGTSIARVHASDPDSELNGIVAYSLAHADDSGHRRIADSWVAGSSGGSVDGERGTGGAGGTSSPEIFAVNETTGDVFVIGHVDFELRRVHELIVVATDMGQDPIPAFAKLTVYVNDVNDNPPRIVVNALSQHRHHKHHQQQQQQQHHVGIATADDTAANEEFAMIAENAPRGTFVCHVKATDPDSELNSRIECSLTSGGKSSALFNLEPLLYDQPAAAASSSSTEYKLVTAAVLDREALSRHRVTIECRDSGRPPLSSSKEIDILVEDENDNTPLLPLDVFFVSVAENSQPGLVITTINATDRDDGPNGQLTYALEPLDSPLSTMSGTSSTGSSLAIDEDSGTIMTQVRFDYELKQTYTFLLTVSDRGETVQRSAVATVVLDVIDSNDELPRFDRLFYSFHVSENRPAKTSIGRVRATDADRSPDHNQIFYFLDDQRPEGKISSAFQVSSMTGELFTRSQLDRETTAIWKFRVRATNDPALGPRSAFSVADIHVHIDDQNDNSPIIVEPSGVNRTYYVRDVTTLAGHVMARVRAIDADDGANARLSYSLLTVTQFAGSQSANQSTAKSRLFTIHETTGDVTATKNIDGHLDAGLYALSIAVRDAGTPKRLTTMIQLFICVNASNSAHAVHYGNNDKDVSNDDVHNPILVDHDNNLAHGSGKVIGAGDGDVSAFLGSGLAAVVVGSIGGLILLLITAIICAMFCGRHRWRQLEGNSKEGESDKQIVIDSIALVTSSLATHSATSANDSTKSSPSVKMLLTSSSASYNQDEDDNQKNRASRMSRMRTTIRRTGRAGR